MNFIEILKTISPVSPPHEIHKILSEAVMSEIAVDWRRSAIKDTRRAAYLSMEFLMGRAVYNNLLCLGLTDEAKKAFGEAGADFAVLEEIEDAALGNGGLGRLAACFLDSAAAQGYALDGYGIRYKYGLFKQSISDGFQKEAPDDWTRFGDPWSVRREEDSVFLEYADLSVKAVPYDMPIIGRGKENIRTLRLWQAEPVREGEFDFAAFDKGEYLRASENAVFAENISRCLYPNDSTYEGLKLRLRQEYFFSAASMRDILKKHKQSGKTMQELPEYISIQLNDTHPVIAIPEMIRILVDGEGLKFSDALVISRKIFNYTNHTIMAEALEKWNIGLVKDILPRIYEICLQINEAFIDSLYVQGLSANKINHLRIIEDDTLHMARMAIYCASAVNGVAQLHTDILKADTLKEWYELYPAKFRNKTNGITPRRWLKLCNPGLSGLITELLGDDCWVYDLSRLNGLKKYADDKTVISRFSEIKRQNKIKLADYIKAHEGVVINPDSIFDIQIKRLHEYKRQLLNAFSILYLYFGIKDGRFVNFEPMTFIFGAKSAPAYMRAKGIIKYINEIAALIDGDKQVRELIKVVFVQNYNVSYAEKLVVAADVSEQISTAGTEASGTGNMKFMLNGTVTLGTMDGANVEIAEEAGAENNYFFGAEAKELGRIMQTYEPRRIAAADPQIRRVLQTLIDGTVSDNGTGLFSELYFALTDGASWHVPDHYYLLGDLNSYVNAKLQINADYRDDREEFFRKCWLNTAGAGKFSSDRTIKDYAENIWKI
ncbi:MAG: glycogen/starch/alpha-glucan phosphorylase [Oscillospiraceae bacterium]|jgi:starch phosphorylase|nr:glycogen/starch/alpha-glucan phosphorylase [Oscillospiraceae bacterium]